MRDELRKIKPICTNHSETCPMLSTCRIFSESIGWRTITNIELTYSDASRISVALATYVLCNNRSYHAHARRYHLHSIFRKVCICRVDRDAYRYIATNDRDAAAKVHNSQRQGSAKLFGAIIALPEVDAMLIPPSSPIILHN